MFTIGIRESTISHTRTRRCPRKLVASTPVKNTTSTVSTTPRPGRLRPTTATGCQLAGSSDRLRSIVEMMVSSTHRVMPIGTQIRSPVMK